ncbi:PREDICTED: mediator of RNA polymerase II transcription subunit 15 [Drosophila arizonae]|uniref:Mediator of RNA polymerase II transcription subunit 15 n=1 Tax=Drosophila arizonae TaxID=7263 RepID=A0ABM1PVM0_DROAR|nr:PREDICTED: mediator of RNA polymerase II transcription subunit 15 [Drosophila arizonae]
MTQNLKELEQELQLLPPSPQSPPPQQQQQQQQQQQLLQQNGQSDDEDQQPEQPKQEQQQEQQPPEPPEQQPQQKDNKQQQKQQAKNKIFSSDAELLRDLAKSQPQQTPQSPHEKRIGLIAAMGHFRPKNATPIQFYNYVREFCIMHNCSIDEAMERAPDAWTKLSKDQRKLYNSEMHAALPIPVPRHLIYRAFQMERAGRWKISSTPAANGTTTLYSMESYSPPVKPTKLQARLKAQQPRYDNLAEIVPCIPESPRAHPTSPSGSSPKAKASSDQREKREKTTLTLRELLSEPNLKGLRKARGGGKAAPAAPASTQKQQQPAQRPTPAKCKSKKLLNTSSVKKKQQQPEPDQLKPPQKSHRPEAEQTSARSKLPANGKRKHTLSKKSKSKS